MKYDVGTEFRNYILKNKDFDGFSLMSNYNGFNEYFSKCTNILSNIGEYFRFKPGSFKDSMSKNSGSVIGFDTSDDICVSYRLDDKTPPIFEVTKKSTGTQLFNSFSEGLYGISVDYNGCYLFQSVEDNLEVHYYDNEAYNAVLPLLNEKGITCGNFLEYGIFPDDYKYCSLKDFDYGKFLAEDAKYLREFLDLENNKNQGKSR